MTTDPDTRLARLARRLAEADRAVAAHPEPRTGPEFEAAVRRWQTAYRALVGAATATTEEASNEADDATDA